MKLPARQLMAKAVFAVAVVATTATVGIVGFAQAASQPTATQQSGYGGIDGLLAAVNEFRQSILSATTDYRHDVDVCLDGSPAAQALDEHAKSTGKTAQLKPAKDNFKHRLDDTVGTLNTRVGDTRSAQEGSGAFERNYDDATNQVMSQVDGAKDQLAADLGDGNQATARQNQGGGELFQCLDRAQDKYHHATDTAKAKLLAAIRHILG